MQVSANYLLKRSRLSTKAEYLGCFVISPYGPFVPATPEIAMQMMQKGLPGPYPAQLRKPSGLGPMLPMYPSFPLGSRTYKRLAPPLIYSVS